MDSQGFAYLDAFFADVQNFVVSVFVPPVEHVTVYINNVFSRNGNRIVGLVFLANSFGEQPIQNREINVNWGNANTMIS